jgi:hypothetical protein
MVETQEGFILQGRTGIVLVFHNRGRYSNLERVPFVRIGEQLFGLIRQGKGNDVAGRNVRWMEAPIGNVDGLSIDAGVILEGYGDFGMGLKATFRNDNISCNYQGFCVGRWR